MSVAEANRHNDQYEHNGPHMDFGETRRWTKRLRIVPIRRPSVAPPLCHRGCTPAFRRAAFHVRQLIVLINDDGLVHITL